VRKTILACAAAALIAGATSATAASLVTSADIKNGTIRASDIKKGTISESRLSTGVRGMLLSTGQAGPVGPAGNDGATVYGPKGDAGPEGPAGPIGPPGRDGSGNQGPQGAAGPQGPQGPPGATGPQGLQGVAGPTGLKGDAGDRGPAGATGAQGPPGVAGFETASASESWGVGTTHHETTVTCPGAKIAVGGGFSSQGVALGVTASRPGGGQPARSWVVEGFNTSTADVTVQTWAVCASVG
jgi:Collagen triple helix repeat (20 copies)